MSESESKWKAKVRSKAFNFVEETGETERVSEREIRKAEFEVGTTPPTSGSRKNARMA